MHQCPKCGSTRVHYSRTKSLWEKWRRRITGKRPYRCHGCQARMWSFDSGVKFEPEVIEEATRAIAPEPPNLKIKGLSRKDKHHAIKLMDIDKTISRQQTDGTSPRR